MNRTDVAELLHRLIGEQQATAEEPYDGPITGETAPLEIMDSMGLVTLLADLEDEIDDETGIAITIADERAMSAKRSPFRSVDALVDYIAQLLEENRVSA
jgi:acyl carrier protein